MEQNQTEKKESIKVELTKLIFVTVDDVLSDVGQQNLPSFQEDIFLEFKKIYSGLTKQEFLSIIATIFRALMRLEINVTERVQVEKQHLIRYYQPAENMSELVEMEITDLVHELLIAFFFLKDQYQNGSPENNVLELMTKEPSFASTKNPELFVSCFQATLSVFNAIGFDNKDTVDVYF
jgi:hypothetical protein